MAANNDGSFKWEMAPITVAGLKKGDVVIDKDEQPFKVQHRQGADLKPAFRKDGTVTAATSSSISDGAAAMVMMRFHRAETGSSSRWRSWWRTPPTREPQWFTTARSARSRSFYAKPRNTGSVDLFEINEAFAVVAMAAMKEHGIPHAKVNIHGGACALGHPIGASGARLIVT